MKTDAWEDLFREQVNGLDSPPPQTGWNGARSWDKLEKQLTSPAKPAGRRLAWWTYAAAAIVLLVPALFLNWYFQGQREEIDQLKMALEKVKTTQADSIGRPSLARVEVPTTEPKKSEAIPGKSEAAQVKNARPVNQEKTKRPVPKAEIREMPLLGPDAQIAESKPEPTDTAVKQVAVAPDAGLSVTFIQKAPKTPASRKVVLVFKGNQVEDTNTHLAETPSKPAKKFIFLSGEKEASPVDQPENLPSPFAFTVKPRKSLH
jgi:hypothetical protein